MTRPSGVRKKTPDEEVTQMSGQRGGLLVMLGVLLSTSLAATAEPQFVEEVQQDDRIKLDWVWQMNVTGLYLFVTSHRDGDVNVFRRDEKTGAVQFINRIDVNEPLGAPTRHMDPYAVLSPEQYLYVSGLWTHAHSDNDSTGLTWYKFNKKDGSGERLGHISCPAGRIYASDHPNLLYLGELFSGAVQEVWLQKDGSPKLGNQIKSKGFGLNVAFSPDGRQIYSFGSGAVGWANVGAGGALFLSGTVDISSPAKEGAVTVSPDGKFVYVTCKKGPLCTFSRDEKTGALKLVEEIAENPFSGTIGMLWADNAGGYFCAHPETPASGLGWFSRDPATGKLAFGGKAKRAIPACGFDYVPETGTIYHGGFWSSKKFQIFKVPPMPRVERLRPSPETSASKKENGDPEKERTSARKTAAKRRTDDPVRDRVQGFGVVHLRNGAYVIGNVLEFRGNPGSGEVRIAKADGTETWIDSRTVRRIENRHESDKRLKEREAEVEQAPSESTSAKKEDARADREASASPGWPRWRGPNANHFSNLPGMKKNWGTGLRRVFSFNNLSDGDPTENNSSSSPAIYNGICVVMGRTGGAEGKDVVHGLDAGTGKPLWKQTYDAPGKLSGKTVGYGARGMPCIDAECVFTLGAMGHLACWDLKSGRRLWFRNAREDAKTNIPYWGCCSAPAVYGNAVMVQVGGYNQGPSAPLVLAYDKRTGNPVWQAEKDKGSWAPLAVVKLDGRDTLLAFAAGGLKGLDPSNGRQIWDIPWKTAYDCNASLPGINGSTLFVTTGYGNGCQAFSVQGGTVTPLWEKSKAVASCNSDPIIVDGFAYSFSGNGFRGSLSCLDLKSGEVKWSTKELNNGAMVFVDGCLLCQCCDGRLALVEAKPDAFGKLTEMKVFDADEKLPAYVTPAIAYGCVYLRHKAELLCLSLVN